VWQLQRHYRLRRPVAARATLKQIGQFLGTPPPLALVILGRERAIDPCIRAARSKDLDGGHVVTRATPGTTLVATSASLRGLVRPWKPRQGDAVGFRRCEHEPNDRFQLLLPPGPRRPQPR
jgi:hypothetical protein